MKHKVFNNNPFSVGIKFENDRGREVVIKGKKPQAKAASFVMLEEDDILYVDSVSSLFSNGVIYIDDQDMLEKMGYIEKNPNTISDEDIEKLLKAKNPSLKKEIKEITAPHAQDKVIEHAKKMDLPQSKIKILEDEFGKKIFEELGDDIV